MYTINHFDNYQNVALDEIKIKYAKQSILDILPDLNRDDVSSQKIQEIKLDELVSLV